jgi:uncharacterized protein (TIGR02186 family)
MRLFLLLFCFLVFAPPVKAATLTLDAAPEKLIIGQIFGGAVLTVFGLAPKDGQTIILMEGPRTSYIVHKKQQTGPFWLNGPSRRIKDVPSFYLLAGNGNVEEFGSEAQSREWGVGYKSLFSDPQDGYAEALLRIKERQKLYARRNNALHINDNGMFRMDIPIPSNIPTGVYRLRLLHMKDGRLSGAIEKRYMIDQTGFNQTLTELIFKNSLLFSILAVGGAMALGFIGTLLAPRRG